MLEFDLSDPKIRAMVERDHEPDEAWSMGGDLLSVDCRCCNRPWPCQTILSLRERQRASFTDVFTDTMSRRRDRREHEKHHGRDT